MASEQQDKGFRVTDRRASAQLDNQVDQDKAPAPEAQPQQQPQQPVEGPGWRMKEEKPQQPLPPITFTTLCLSLASSAMIHLGLTPSPESGQPERNLPLAQQTIDMLALLEEKTRNNLTPEEARLLSTLLYDLRMRFLEARKG